MKSFIAVWLSVCAWRPARPGLKLRHNRTFGGQPANSATVVRLPRRGTIRLIKSGSKTPDLTPVADLKPPSLDLPQEPIEPYLSDQGERSVHGAGEGISRR